MKNADYWRARFEALELALLDYGDTYYVELERQYREAMRSIEHDITVWYKRMAMNNGISFADAQQLLTGNELEEFRWDIEDYIKHGKESSISQQWLRQLENASAKAHITKLDAIKMQIQQAIESLCGTQLNGMSQTMQQIYSDGYYHTVFEVQKGIGVGSRLERLNQSKVEKVISKPWAADGEDFSDRIWTNKDKLVNQLHTELTQATIRGDGLDKLINTLSAKMNTSKSAAGRLVMTESAFFASASQRDCFSSLGVKQYEIVATLDSHTSETCQHLDGKVFKMSDFKVGVTAPPFHCRCRSCTAPYFDDDSSLRAARGKDGKTYNVPADMKYEEWAKTYIK